jgi:ABC-type transport system involved in multi-copper enzyme maturation permease subunit
MRGLFTKTLHEVWLTTLLFGFALFAVKALLTYILPQFQEGLGDILEEIPFVKTMITAMLGTELGDKITARTMQTFLWVHPVVLALVWAYEIVLCTRIPAGEIDRGTIDVLLGLPVSRRAVYFCETVVWLVSGLLILGAGLLGHRIAAPAMPAEMRPELDRAALIIANLYCVYLAVGGIAFLVSAFSDRRGRAMAIVFAVVLGSFLLNFVAQFWEPARQIAFLGVMQYYQPAQILQSGEFPIRDVTVLLVVGGSAWLVGGEVVARRSICTV